MDKISNSETGCCERFNPKPWDNKTIMFKDKLFLKDHIKTAFHIPIGFGKVMTKNMEFIAKANALSKEQLMLYDCRGMFGADLYIAVTKNVPGAEMAKISGTFMSKVFEGPFKDTGKWVKEMKIHVERQGKTMKKLYFYYTMCPACAKHYGQNYTVLLAQV